jgi:hypothetical protein
MIRASFTILCSIIIFFNPTIGEAKVSKYQVLLQDATQKIKLLNVSGTNLTNRLSIPNLQKKYPKNPFIPVNPTLITDAKSKLTSASNAVKKLNKKDQSKYAKALTATKATINRAELFSKIITTGNQFLLEFTTFSKNYELDPLNKDLNSIYLSLQKKQTKLLSLIKSYSIKSDRLLFLERYDQNVYLIGLNPSIEQERIDSEKKQHEEELAKEQEQVKKIQTMLAMKETSEKERLAIIATKYTKTMITNKNLLNLVSQQEKSKDSISWYGYELEDIDLYFTEEALHTQLYLLDHAQPIIDQIKKYFGGDLRNKINVFIYDGEKLEGTENQYRVRGDYAYLNVTINDGNLAWDERYVFAHEMAHAFQQHLWTLERLFPVYRVDNVDALWLTEGMAEYVAKHVIQYKPLYYPRNLFLRFTNFDHLSYPILLDNFVKRSNTDLTAIHSWPSSFWAADDYIAYESFVYFLEKQYGHELFMNWIDYASTINNLEEATVKFFNKTSKEIIAEWKIYYKIGQPVTSASQIYIVDFIYREDPLISQLPYLSKDSQYVIMLRDYLVDPIFKDLTNRTRNWEISLTAPGKPSLKANIVGGFTLHNNQALQLSIPDYAKMVNGVNYKLEIKGTGDFKVNIPDDFVIVKP